MFKLFIEGGAFGMSILTLAFIALLLAAWKAPGWVKEIGLIALVWGLFYNLYGLYGASSAVQQAGDVPVGLFFGGLKVALIPLLYGMVIYIVSLVIRIVQKPRLL